MEDTEKDGSAKEEDLKEEEEIKEKPESEESEDLEAILKSCGLPTSFGSKKQKR